MKSHALGIRVSARCLLVSLSVVPLLIGCAAPPANPFLSPQAAVAPTTDEPNGPPFAVATDGTHGSMPAEVTDHPRTLQGEAAEFKRLGAGVALAAVGLGKEVRSAAKDAANRVRHAAATTLDQQRDEAQRVAHHAVETARQMAVEALTQTQRQAIDSLAQRPLEQAGPILILAIAEGGPETRRAAAQQLAERWPPAADFPVDAAAESRQTALVALRSLWAEQYGQLEREVAERTAAARQLLELSTEQARQARRLLDTLKRENLSEIASEQAAAALVAYGPPLIPMLEQELETRGVLPPELYTDVLPTITPAFEALARLQAAEDAAARRAAATELATFATSDVLPPLAVSRLAELIADDPDPEVWRDALHAVASSAHASAEQMAHEALHNASDEVRQAACDYFGQHGDPRYIEALLQMLNDPNTEVQLAAVRALGAAGSWDDPRPLVALLDAEDKRFRVESALALARLNEPRGAAALERLALNTDLEIRLRAAQAMGEIADPLFLPSLVAMLGDQAEVQQAAMRSLVDYAGRDVAASNDGEAPTPEQRVARWRNWYAQREHTASITPRRF